MAIHKTKDEQKRIHRNWLYYFVPIALFFLTLLLLVWAIVRQNLSVSTQSSWPWKLQLLDIQSATTAATITGGLILARAQYAVSVRPAISWGGNWEGKADDNWTIRLSNGSPATSYFKYLQYRVIPEGKSFGANEGWVPRDEAEQQLEDLGLRQGEDFALNLFGPKVPMSGTIDDNIRIAWFSERAIAALESVEIKVRAVDQAGDVHQRIVYCWRGIKGNEGSQVD